MIKTLENLLEKDFNIKINYPEKHLNQHKMFQLI